MKNSVLKRAFYFLMMTFLLLVISSCKKNSDKSSSTTLEYKISPMNRYFTTIKYNDNTGNSVMITDPSQFSTGVKDISISVKPFDAKLETQINNTTAQAISYTLAILVDGQVVKLIQASGPAMQTSSGSVEYTIR